MSTRRILAASVVLLVSSASAAMALDNVVVGDGRCLCMCETANSGYYGTYDSVGYGCGALENRTCNIENPNTGLIETGRLWGCSPASSSSGNGRPATGGILTPGGSGPVTVRPGLAAPIQGVLQR